VAAGGEFHGRQRGVSTQQQKLFVWERVANEVRRLGATVVVSIAETWLGPVEDVARGIPPSRSRQRKEAIDVSVASIDGRSLTYLTVFRRRLGRIVFDRTEIADSGHPFFLEPVRRVWKEMVGAKSGSRGAAATQSTDPIAEPPKQSE
jgi:hypothetical protein